MYIIDGSAISTREEAYSEIRRALEAPEYFGNNLDALNDILTGMEGEIRFTHACHMLNALGAYGCRLLSVFYAAAEENSRITFTAGGRE